MAKESMKAREVKRAKMVAKYAEKRKALKEAGDYEALQKLPKNASPIRNFYVALKDSHGAALSPRGSAVKKKSPHDCNTHTTVK